MSAPRQSDLHGFVAAHLPSPDFRIEPASADASFRSYWRVSADEQTWVVMDAPPDKENIQPWLDIGARLHAAGLHTPRVVAVDATHGFILMEDLGNCAYLPELNVQTADSLYRAALDALFVMQTRVSAHGLPAFDAAFLRMELEIMPTWLLQRHLGHALDDAAWRIIETAFHGLIDNARAQPQVFMHRDFHSRNLMIVAENNPGIIDFQGAVLGPITYDIASLLRDCYIAWPIERVDGWLEQYRQRLAAANVLTVDSAQFRRWFDLVGLQRHIKVLGLFCRLNYRDAKPAYLHDLPLTLNYVLGVARRYPELVAFADLIERAIGGRDITLPRAAATIAA